MKWFKKLCPVKLANSSNLKATSAAAANQSSSDSSINENPKSTTRSKTGRRPVQNDAKPPSTIDDSQLLGFPPISQPPPTFARGKYDPQRAFQDKQRRLYSWLRQDRQLPDSDEDANAQRQLLPPPIPRSFVISDCRNCGETDDSNSDSDHHCGKNNGESGESGESGEIGETIGELNDIDPIFTDGECYNQLRQLKQFISDPEATTRLPHRQRATQLRRQKVRRRVHRGFFNIPGEMETVRYQTDEQSPSDWVVISIELEHNQSCDSLLDENLINLIQDATKNNPVPESLAIRPSIDVDYGLIYTRNRHLRRLLRLIKFLDFDIRFGQPLSEEEKMVQRPKPSLDALIAAAITRAKYERRRRRREARVQKSKVRVEVQPEPCCSTTMAAKMDRMTETLFNHRPIAAPQLPAATEIANASAIARHFGLNANGDIIIHLDHIVEQKGYGFLMRRKQRVYRHVGFAKEIDECVKVPIKFRTMIRNVVRTLQTSTGNPCKRPTNAGAGDSLAAYTLSLATNHTSTFSRNIENFISLTKQSRETSPQVVMRNMRQFMSGMINYLVMHGEGDFQCEVQRERSILKHGKLNLETILERVMHTLVVLPLREHLYGLLVSHYARTGDLQLLMENVPYACDSSLEEFGFRPSVEPPNIKSMQKISNMILHMQETELPMEKLDILLSIISTSIEATKMSRSTHAMSADDFLPLLIYIVAKCGFIGAEIEAEFMWCLLPASMQSGEAGYCLTALSSAAQILKTFKQNAQAQHGNANAHCRPPTLHLSSSVLRVAIPDAYNGSLRAHTLPIRPNTTTKDVCRIIAHAARINNPLDYGLFKMVNGEETRLMDADCPQEARLKARGKPCTLTYKRIATKSVWPSTSTVFH